MDRIKRILKFCTINCKGLEPAKFLHFSLALANNLGHILLIQLTIWALSLPWNLPEKSLKKTKCYFQEAKFCYSACSMHRCYLHAITPFDIEIHLIVYYIASVKIFCFATCSNGILYPITMIWGKISYLSKTCLLEVIINFRNISQYLD
jgi:hypothetical protein